MLTLFVAVSGIVVRFLFHGTRQIRDAARLATSHLETVQAAKKEIESTRWVIKAVSYIAQAEAFEKGHTARTIFYQMAHQALTEALGIDPSDGAALIWKGWTLKRLGSLEEALGCVLQAMSIRELPLHESARAHYNAAAYSALLAERSPSYTAPALDNLAKAINLQEVYRRLARDDPDFAPLRSHVRFQELIGDSLERSGGIES